MAMLTIFCIGFSALSFEFNNIAYSVQTQQMNDVASNELLVYKGVDRQGFVEYDFGGSNDLISDDELSKIKQLSHVTDVEWRYDIDLSTQMLFPVTDKRFSSYDYKAEPFILLEDGKELKKLIIQVHFLL